MKEEERSNFGHMDRDNLYMSVNSQLDDSSDDESSAYSMYSEESRSMYNTAGAEQDDESGFAYQLEADVVSDEEDSNLYAATSVPTSEDRPQSDLLQEADQQQPSGKDWNSEFQTLLAQKDCEAKYRALYSLAHDFCYSAKIYGKIIISEMHLPNEEKTIRPTSIGGIAGGAKYISHSIFFKFATDQQIGQNLWMYGGSQRDDDAARKAAGLEFQGLAAFYDTRVRGLHYPLFALIDFRGYRLCAMSIIPIGKDTLIYGSSDGGHTVHARNFSFNNLMAKAGGKLNLKPHVVKEKLMLTPGDIEGHLGRDGLFYVLDFARTFPPEAPRTNQDGTISRAVYYEHFRPEFVLNHRVPLSPDVFTRWGHIDRRVHNSEVRDATHTLLETVIPTYAKKLNSSSHMIDKIRPHLAAEFHSAGIGIRHMGLVRAHCSNPAIRSMLLLEMIVRTTKEDINRQLRHRMEAARLPVQLPYVEVVLHYLNVMLGGKRTEEDRVATRVFWKGRVKHLLISKFRQSLTLAEWDERMDLRYTLDMIWLVERLQQCAGIKLGLRVQREVSRVWSQDIIPGSIGLMDGICVLDSDIEKFGAIVKHLNVVDEAEAMALFYEAKNSTGTLADQLWTVMNAKFQSANAGSIYNSEILYEWGNALFTQGKRRRLVAEECFINAEQKFERCVQQNTKHHRAWYRWALVLVTHGCLLHPGTPAQNLKVAQAAGKFKQALSLHPVYAVKLKQRALRKLEKGRKLAKGLWEDRGILGRIHDFFPISAGAQKNSVAYRNFMCSMIDAMSCFKLLLGSYDQLKNEALGFSEILYQLCTVLIDLVVHSAHDSSYLLSEAAFHLEGFLLRNYPSYIADDMLVYSISHPYSTQSEDFKVEVHSLDRLNDSSVSLIKTEAVQYQGAKALNLMPYVEFLRDPQKKACLELAEQLKGFGQRALLPNKPGGLVFASLYDQFTFHQVNLQLADLEDTEHVSPAKVDIYVVTDLLPEVDLQNFVLEGVSTSERKEFCKKHNASLVASFNLLKSNATTRCFSEQAENAVRGRFLLLSFSPPKGKVSKVAIKSLSVYGTRHPLEVDKSGLTSVSATERDLFRFPIQYQGVFLASFLRLATYSNVISALFQAHLRSRVVRPVESSGDRLRASIGHRTALKGSRIKSKEVAPKLKTYKYIHVDGSPMMNDEAVHQLRCISGELDGLDFEQCWSLTDASADLFAACNGLKMLRLKDCKQLSCTTLQAVAKSCLSLEEFSLQPICESGVNLSSISTLTQLQVLSIKNTDTLTDKDLILIAKKCTCIRELELSECPNISDKGFTAVLKGSCHQILESLVLDYCPKLTNKSVSLLSSCSSLSRLSLAAKEGVTNIGDDGVVPIVLNRPLEYLILNGCSKITNSCLNAACVHAEALVTLDLSLMGHITDNSLVYLGKATKSLKYLMLSQTSCTDFSYAMFASNNSQLAMVALDGCSFISDESLVMSIELKNLFVLSIKENQRITNYGVHILLTNSPELKMVDLSGCDKLSASFMRKLRDTCECAMLFDADFGVAS